MKPRTAFAIVTLTWLGLLLARATAPSDLCTRDQERVGTYVLDILLNGHWLCQLDVWDNVASKPPLFNWLAALASDAAGTVTRFTLGIPSGIATVIVAWLVLMLGSQRFGRVAGVCGSLLYMVSQLGLRQVFLVRTDAVFQCTVFVGAWLGYRAWRSGRGWIWFWLLAALATLTKGPLGLLLASTGFVAALWERRSGSPRPLRGRIWPGLIAYVGIGLAWFLAADASLNGRVWDKLIMDELVGHAVGGDDRFGYPGQRLFHPTAFLMTRVAPLGWFVPFALWRIARRPDPDPDRRWFDRYWFCQFAVGMAIFSLAASNRFVHLLPLMPAAAILAGREAALLLRRYAHPVRATAIFGAVSVAGAFVYLHVIDASKWGIVRSENARDLADELEARLGRGGIQKLIWRESIDTPLAVQIGMDVFTPAISFDATIDALCGDEPAWLVERHIDEMQAAVTTRGGPALHVPFGVGDKQGIHVISNRPELPPFEAGPPLGRGIAGVLVAIGAAIGLAQLGGVVFRSLRDVGASAS